jgi:rare lipoprotein A (peptidoglycan hydrolase)
MTMSRARFAAGATAVCATLAVVPATASTGTPAQAAAAAAPAAAVPQTERVRKRTPTVRVKHVRRNVIAGRTASVSGTLQPGMKGHVVRLQTRTGRGWHTVDRTLTRAKGAYRLSYRPSAPGTATLRVLFPGDRTAKPAHRAAGRVNVFRRAVASWYGLYGSALACGGTLGYSELGVAHKTLPCGTKLTLRYRGRSVRVRVIDRGPYVGGRDFDLTGATKRALGFGDVGTVLATR